MGKTPSPAHTSGGVTRLIPVTKSRANREHLLRLTVVFAVLFFSGFTAAFGQSSVESLRPSISGGNVEQKRDALLRLRNLHTPEASRAAVPALQDSNDMVRATAAGSVVFLPTSEAINVLLPLLKDKSPFVRKEAAYAVREVGDPKTLLGEEQDDVIATALRLLLEKDKDPEVRGAAAVAMGKAGGLKSVWYLYFFLQSSPKDEASEFIRRSAVRSIGTVAERLRESTDSVPSVRRDPQRDQYHELDLSSQFRSFASASRLLLDVLQNKSESDDIRREAAKALGNIGALSAAPVLTANLNASDPYLANICKEALQKLKNIKPL